MPKTVKRKALAREFGVGYKAISKIVSNKRWKANGE